MIQKLIKDYYQTYPSLGQETELHIHAENNKLKVVIPNRCEWLHKSGGCSFCSYSSRKDINAFEIFKNNIDYILAEAKSHKSDYETVDFYMNGSFFNESEVSIASQNEVIEFFTENFNVKKIRIESRPEFISKERILEIRNCFNVNLEIGIGLETTNDEIRTKCINKGFSLQSYLDVYHKIKDICTVRTYLTFKPPFISEKAAIIETIDSIELLLNEGVRNIGITPIVIYEDSFMKFLVEEYFYRPAWLWSLIDINQKLFDLFPEQKLSITGLDFIPEPIMKPFNCEKCSDEIYHKLNENPHLKWDDLGQLCSCHDEWIISVRDNNSKSRINDEIKSAESRLNKIKNRSESIVKHFTASPNIILKDVVKDTPDNKLEIENVGITDYQKQIQFLISINNHPIDYTADCTINANTSLDVFHRGIHMSRIVEVVESIDCLNLDDIDNNAKKILDGICLSQNSHRASININTKLYLPYTTKISEKHTHITTDLKLSFSKKQKTNNISYSISFPILNACPCTLYNSTQLLNESYTHMQRGRILLTVNDSNLRISDIYEFLLNNITPPIPLLKREDEMELVKNKFLFPEFCEDMTRRLCTQFIKDYKGNKGIVEFRIKTYESIHNHNVETIKIINLN